MAKQMFMQTALATAHRGNNDANLAGTATWWRAQLLAEVRGASSSSSTVNTVLGPTNGLEVITGATPYEWISEPLSADFTIAGTITVNLWGNETNMTDNAGLNVAVDKIDAITGALTSIAISANATELGTTASANNFTVTPTSTICKRGDRLRVRVFADDAGGTMASGSIITFLYSGNVAAASGDSYVQFTENLTFEPSGDPPVIILGKSGAGLNFPLNGPSGGTQYVAQPFVAQGGSISLWNLTLRKQGAPTDNFIMEVWSDNGGVPGSLVGPAASLATIPGTALTTSMAGSSGGASGVNLVPGQLYWLLCRRSGALDTTNYYVIDGGGIADATSPASANFSGSTWAANANTLHYQLSFNSIIYLTDTAETINPGAATEKKTAFARGSGSVNAITNTAAGPVTPIQVTATAGGTAIEWYTPPLQAFTLGGKTKFNIHALESSLSANASLKAEIAICANDGTSPVVWGVADLDPNTAVGGGIGEINTTDSAMSAWVSGDDTAVSANQRLRFRIFVDDSGGAPLASGFTATVSYNGATAGAAGDTFVLFPVTVLQLLPIDAATIATVTTINAPESAVYVEQPQIDLGNARINISNPMAVAGATGYAQSFVSSVAQFMNQVVVYLTADVGADGNVEVGIWNDSAGHPNINLGTQTIPASSLTSGSRFVTFDFGSISLAASTTYWITLRRVSGTTSNVYVGIDRGNPYAPSDMQTWTVSGNTVTSVSPTCDMTASVLMKTGVVPLTSVTTPSGTDAYQRAPTSDAATLATVTIISFWFERTDFVDSGTIVTSSTPSSTDIAATVDSAVIFTDAQVSGVEVHEIPDANTITSKTSLSAIEGRELLDANTGATVTTPSSAEVYTPGGIAYTEAATVASITAVSSAETFGHTDANTVASSVTPSSTDIAATVDSATCAVVTTPSAVDLHEIPDAGVITGKTTPSSADIAAFVDAASIFTDVQVSGVEIGGYADAQTASSITNPSSADVAAFTETALVTGKTTPGGTEVYILPPQHLRPIGDVAVNGWLPSDGVSPLYSLIDDTTPDAAATYIYMVAI